MILIASRFLWDARRAARRNGPGLKQKRHQLYQYYKQGCYNQFIKLSLDVKQKNKGTKFVTVRKLDETTLHIQNRTKRSRLSISESLKGRVTVPLSVLQLLLVSRQVELL